jgi:hypothetical protein
MAAGCAYRFAAGVEVAGAGRNSTPLSRAAEKLLEEFRATPIIVLGVWSQAGSFVGINHAEARRRRVGLAQRSRSDDEKV